MCACVCMCVCVCVCVYMCVCVCMRMFVWCYTYAWSCSIILCPVFSRFVNLVCRHLVEILELSSPYDKVCFDTGQYNCSHRSMPYIALKSVEDSTYFTTCCSLHDGWKMYIAYRKYVCGWPGTLIKIRR
jgi:hypothetical protein